MSIPLLLLILILGHVLGDFYCQWNYMATEKKKSYKWLFAHGFVYSVCMAASLLVLMCFGGIAYSHNLLWIFIWVSLLHFIIDLLKNDAIWDRFFAVGKVGFIKRIQKFNITKWLVKWHFSIDQAAHFIILFLAWYFWGRELTVGLCIYDHAHHLTIVLGLLVLLRPVGLLLGSGAIWTFNKQEENGAQTQKENDTRAEDAKQKKDSSRLIGYLERIIVFFLLLNGEYSTIALVIAAKSIARFPEIKDEKGHLRANDYIIGTFLSLTAVIAVTVVLGLISV